MIRSIARRMNDLGAALRSVALSDEIRSRAPTLRRPNTSVDRALGDLDQAAQLMESVRVYATHEPISEADARLWNEEPGFRESIKRKLASAIADGLMRDGVMQIDMIETDKANVKAVMGQAAMVTAGPAVKFMTDQLGDAFKAGAEAMRLQLLDYAQHSMPSMRREDQFDHMVRVMQATQSARILVAGGPPDYAVTIFDAVEWFNVTRGRMCTVRIEPRRSTGELRRLRGCLVEIDRKTYRVQAVETFAVPDHVSADRCGLLVTEA